jgi:hypothetical protein
MGIIKEKFKAKADATAAEIKEILKEHGNKKIGEVTLSQVFQGMRGMTGLVTETSVLEVIPFQNYNKNYLKLLMVQSHCQKDYFI